jgi:hypothetical protein
MRDFHSVMRRLVRGRDLAAAAAAATIVASGTVLAAIVGVAGRGFDLTDEAYYVLSMQEPAAYRMTSTLFGYALQPAYLLFGGSIAALRIFGVVVLAALGGFAVGLILRSRPNAGRPTTQAVLVAAGAALPAMYYGFWLPTPSYNWLVLAAALILLPAILLLAERDRGPALPAALAALAGLIAAMAKPPTAAAYGIIFAGAVVLLVREPRRIARQLAVAAAFSAAGLAALALVLPLETVWAQTRGYVEMHGAAPPAGRGPLGDLTAFLAHPRGWPFAAALVAVGLATRPERRTGGVVWGRAAAALAIAGAGAGTILAVVFPVYPALGPGMAAVAYAAIALAMVRGADRRLCLALALATVLPWAAALGSTNDLPSQTTFCAGIFGLIALLSTRSVRLAPSVTALVTLALVLITGTAIVKGLGKPYRLAAPVWRQTEPVEIGAYGERLSVDRRTAAFVSPFREAARQAGFCAGDPVIDLTGELPGMAVLLGGRTPGLPWLFGGYVFSEKLATWALSGVDAQTRARAWLVVGEGRIAFSAPFIAELGFAVQDGYTLVLDGTHSVHGTPVRLYRPRSLPGGPVPCRLEPVAG